MAKRKRKPPSKPSKAYLISFGDTMTAMLAFFIVLNTLAKEQTGANLHTGTGSFVSAVRSMGLPGWFSGKTSKRVRQLDDHAPKYIVDDEQQSMDNSGEGHDDENNNLRVLDRDAEQLQRRIVEFEQQFDVQLSEEESAQISFDLFEPLDKRNRQLPKPVRKVLAQSVGLLSVGRYRIEIDVWSPTPSQSAMNRTARQARDILELIGREFNLDRQRRSQLTAATRIWPHSDERRPTITINVIKVTNSD